MLVEGERDSDGLGVSSRIFLLGEGGGGECGHPACFRMLGVLYVKLLLFSDIIVKDF
jgi:hypothetical protein